VAGYELYRRTAAEKSYTKLNPALITELSYRDRSLAATGGTTYYALRAVDEAAQPSVLSEPAAITAGSAPPDDDTASSATVSCFIATAHFSETLETLGLLALAVAVAVGLLRTRRGKKLLAPRSFEL
jgi:hypothetical protein